MKVAIDPFFGAGSFHSGFPIPPPSNHVNGAAPGEQTAFCLTEPLTAAVDRRYMRKTYKFKII